MTSGTIFNIQRFSINDGPGIRTTVFLKGCNMRCFWCHNPESLSPFPQVQYFPQKCIGCGKCVAACPNLAQQMQDGQRAYVKGNCKNSGKCAEVCSPQALVMTGKTMTAAEVLEEIIKDAPFYRISRGGVTFSGGEPLLQKDFLKELLSECKSKGFNTAVDTAANVSWDVFEELLPYTDLFLYDIKCMDEEKHKAATGQDNRRILENIKKLAASGVDIWIRIPVIPGVNDSVQEMEKIGDLLKNLNGIRLVELFPFHRLGKEKYDSLQMEYKADKLLPVPEERLNTFSDIFRVRGLFVKIS